MLCKVLIIRNAMTKQEVSAQGAPTIVPAQWDKKPTKGMWGGGGEVLSGEDAAGTDP